MTQNGPLHVKALLTSIHSFSHVQSDIVSYKLISTALTFLSLRDYERHIQHLNIFKNELFFKKYINYISIIKLSITTFKRFYLE